jgi:hypothetical protein
MAALSEPGSVQTMCSLAAGSSALKAARPMTDLAISQTFPAASTSARQAGQRPDANSFLLCIYSQADKYAYSPLASLLPSANCPGCQRREAAGGHVALPAGWAGARPTRTTPTAPPPAGARGAACGFWQMGRSPSSVQSPPDLPHPQPASREQGSWPAGKRGTASDRPRNSLPHRGHQADRHPCRGESLPRSFWASYSFSGPQ